jgi:arginyl-tRNA synthetase
LNIKKELREKLIELVTEAVKEVYKTKNIKTEIPDVKIEKPKFEGHGDYAVNIAMVLAKPLKMPPGKIAEEITANIPENDIIEKIEVAGPGFINFHLSEEWIYEGLKLIEDMKDKFGKSDIGNGKKVMVEYVSANPTGPPHMGNARGAALGDLIAEVLDKSGYDVTREFYINDAGNQIEKFGFSLEARYLQELFGSDYIEFPEDGYHGDDIILHTKKYIKINGDNLSKLESEERRKVLVDFALKRNLESLEENLKLYGIEFDNWFSEKTLHSSGYIEETISLMKENGYTTEEEGALWFKTTEFGAEKNDVLIRNNGIATYLAADIAYHRNKFEKRKFDRVINLWGADHHGHVERLKNAMTAIGVDRDKLDIVLFQLVRLYRDGEAVRMSKRTGKSISLGDLLEEVGKDAARFIFNMKTSGVHLDFDLGLAVKQSNENPVFYVQYAHARICSILRKLEEENIESKELTEKELSILTEKEEKDLIKKLTEFPDEIEISASTLEPSRLTRYVMEVAALFHSFYNSCRVKGAEEEIMMARIVLVKCVKTVIKNVLDILKISAPEKM